MAPEMWHNRLTNEENFGVIANEAGGEHAGRIHVDGETDDWERRSGETGGATGYFDRLAEGPEDARTAR